MQYHDDFYTIESLPFYQRETILREAYQYCYEWWFDKKEENPHKRQKIQGIQFEETLKYLEKEPMFFFIHRKGYENNKDNWFLEIGFHTTKLNESAYFLWIRVNQEKLNDFIKKYNLEKIY